MRLFTQRVTMRAMGAIEVLRNPQFSSQIFRFLISGGTGATTNFATLYILTEFVGMWYLVSAGLALAAGFAVSFVLQKFWTFQNDSLRRVHIQIPLHVALGSTNVAINTLALFILVEWFDVWYMLAQLLTGACLACFNYYTYQTHIFRQE